MGSRNNIWVKWDQAIKGGINNCCTGKMGLTKLFTGKNGIEK